MKRYWLGLAALSVMSACGSGVFTPEATPSTPGGGGGAGSGGNGGSAPAAIAGDLDSITYSPGDPSTGDPPTLTLTGLPFDSGVTTAEYVRDASLDVGDFQAFTFQANNPGARKYTALVRELDGLVVTTTGSGRLGQFFGGANYERTGNYTAPTDADLPTGIDIGNVVYLGTYAGLINFSDVDSGNTHSVRLSGDVEITGDFRQNRVIGKIDNRQFEDTFVFTDNGGANVQVVGAEDTSPGPLTTVETLLFEASDIGNDGSFTGNVLLSNDLSDKGTYAGAFTGDAGTSVGGVIRADGHISALDNAAGAEVFENGVFTASR